MGKPDPSDDAHRFSPAAPDEPYVYGSCSPGWHSVAGQEVCIEEWISFVESRGVERVCCLLAGRHLDGVTGVISQYEAAFGPENVLHTPVPERRLVDADELQDRILPFLEESVEAGQPVVVQSLTGVCRAGQVLAAWLIYGRGYRPTAAVDTLAKTGRDPTAVVEDGSATRSELFSLLGDLVPDTPPDRVEPESTDS